MSAAGIRSTPVLSVCICILVLFPAAETRASAAENMLVGECRRTDNAPAIDGKLEDESWNGLKQMTDFSTTGAGKQAGKQTSVSVCHDGKRLYIAAWLFEPRLDAMRAQYTKRDDDLWEDDCFEVFIDTNNNRKTFYHFIINSNGALYDSRNAQKKWNAELSVVSGRGQGYWTVELGIPFSRLDVANASGKVFAVNWCRQDKVSPVLSSWSPTKNGFHEPKNFGVLLFDTSVSQLSAQQLKALHGPAPPPPGKPKNLAANGSFEVLVSGAKGEYPRHWAEERWTAEDRLELVTDPQRAHWGRRYLRLSAPGDAEIRVHNISGKPIKVQPGSSHTLRVWARMEPGATEATLLIEPGKGKAALTRQWKEYTCTYSHPSNAQPMDTGMYIGVWGGPAAVDDVSVMPGDDEPVIDAELKANRSDIKLLSVRRAWEKSAGGEQAWEKRVQIKVSELMGAQVSGALVDIPIRDIVPGRFTCRDITQERLTVVDASADAGGQEVPWTLVNTAGSNEQVARRRGTFRIVFVASLPPRSTKTYYVYLAGESEGNEDVEFNEEVPETLASKGTYPHQLEWWRAGVEPRVDVECKEEGGIVTAHVRGWTASRASARLVSPDGKDEIPLPLAASRSEPNLWVCPEGYRLPDGSQEGIWKLAVKFQDASLAEDGGTTTQEAGTTFAHGSALWWDSNVERIYRNDKARYRGDRVVELYAARHETEAFQVAIDTSEDLTDVTLSVTDAVNEMAKIEANHFTVQRIYEVYFPAPAMDLPGWHPDMLLPFRTCDIAAGTRKLAWITVSVPKNARAGVYSGSVIANCAGKKLEIPLKLTVFDFELPDHPSFTVLMGADMLIGRQGRNRTKWFGGDETRYRVPVPKFYLWDESKADFTATLTLARLYAERRMSLHYPGFPK